MSTKCSLLDYTAKSGYACLPVHWSPTSLRVSLMAAIFNFVFFSKSKTCWIEWDFSHHDTFKWLTYMYFFLFTGRTTWKYPHVLLVSFNICTNRRCAPTVKLKGSILINPNKLNIDTSRDNFIYCLVSSAWDHI